MPTKTRHKLGTANGRASGVPIERKEGTSQPPIQDPTTSTSSERFMIQTVGVTEITVCDWLVKNSHTMLTFVLWTLGPYLLFYTVPATKALSRRDCYIPIVDIKYIKDIQ